VEASWPNRSSDTEKWKLRYFCIVTRSMAPSARTSSVLCSFISSQVRWMMRLIPVSPTNIWCASSVSMKRQERASGSKPDSASDASWYLPSRSVKKVNMKKDSQSASAVEGAQDARLVGIA